jgi:hypothetical protein
MRIIIRRFLKDKYHTLGNLYLFNEGRIELTLKTLELAWRDNRRNISCIPEGDYKAIPHIRPNGDWSLWLQDVPNRSAILIHAGNYISDISGCVLPGIMHVDINKDGLKDVKHSGVAMEALQLYTKGEKEIIVTIR